MTNRGSGAAVAADAGLRASLQVWGGGVCHPSLAADVWLPVRRWP